MRQCVVQGHVRTGTLQLPRGWNLETHLAKKTLDLNLVPHHSHHATAVGSSE